MKLNDVVELILIDEGFGFDIEHPIHIHGYSPYLVAYERHAKKPEAIFGSEMFGMRFFNSLYTELTKHYF